MLWFLSVSFLTLAPEVRADTHAGLMRAIYRPLKLLHTHCRPAKLVFTSAQIVNFAVAPIPLRVSQRSQSRLECVAAIGSASFDQI